MFARMGTTMVERLAELYSRCERFWHWSQAALIFVLLFTGAGIHGMHNVIAFGGAVAAHTIAAPALIVLWVFAIFRHPTTGTWRHYLPTTRGFFEVARFYA